MENPAVADVFVYPDDQLIRLAQADALYEVTRNHDAIVAANSQGSVNAATYQGALLGYPGFILRKIRVPELQTQSYCTVPRIIERDFV